MQDTKIHPFFLNDEFFIDEKLQVMKFANEYKVFDKEGNQIGNILQRLSPWGKILRLLVNKKLLGFEFDIVDMDGKQLSSLKRGFTIWMSKINILDAADNQIGFIKQKFSLLKPKFFIFNKDGQQIATIKGDWKAWNFTITDMNDQEIGRVNKKWAGAMKEIFTTADKYHVVINESYAEDVNKVLILSAAIMIDMVLKEN